MADQDYYSLLGVSKECTESELKKAWVYKSDIFFSFSKDFCHTDLW